MAQNNKAEIGRKFLSEHQDTHHLRIIYEDDGAPHIDLCEIEQSTPKEGVTETTFSNFKPLDMTAIYEQVGQLIAS